MSKNKTVAQASRLRVCVRSLAIGLIAVALGAATARAARVLWSATNADSAPPSVAGDPVEKQVRRETLSQLPEMRQKPAPFQKLDIPEPRVNPRLIGLREQPADNDPPVLSTGTPPRPVLPLAKP